jgi:hypothetical protein
LSKSPETISYWESVPTESYFSGALTYKKRQIGPLSDERSSGPLPTALSKPTPHQNMSSTSTSHQRRVSGRATKGVGKPHFEPNTGGGLATKLSTPEASATTRSTRAGTPPPRTPHHYPDSPQSSANVTALPAVVARPDPPPDDHSSRTSFRHALITHCLLPAGCYGQDPRAAATTTPSARRSLTLTATTSAAARRRLQHRPREWRRRLLTGPVRHRQGDR